MRHFEHDGIVLATGQIEAIYPIFHDHNRGGERRLFSVRTKSGLSIDFCFGDQCAAEEARRTLVAAFRSELARS